MEKERRKKERKRTKENFSIGRIGEGGDSNNKKKKAQEMDL